MSTCSIYKITSPSNKIYIGQTINFERRLSEYKNLECKTQLKLYSSLVKYGFENHVFEILEICSIEDANFRERHYQEFFDVLSKKGLNLKYQSTTDKKCIYSEETKQKISKSKIGKKKSEETKLKMSKAKSGKNHPMYGKPIHLGRKLTKEHSEILKKNREILAKQKSKPVLQYDKEGNLINEFPSAREAGRQLNLSQGNISFCCTGKKYYKSVGGFIFKYKNN
jgi:group I intron endonuclease